MEPFQFQFEFEVCQPPLMDPGNMFHLMFRTLLMQATQLPQKMMEWMRLTSVHCAPCSTPPHFVVNVMKSLVPCVSQRTNPIEHAT